MHGSKEVAARKLLEETRAKLRARTAVPEDYRPALEAIVLLPDDEGAAWLSEFRREFVFVYARRTGNPPAGGPAAPAAARSPAASAAETVPMNGTQRLRVNGRGLI